MKQITESKLDIPIRKIRQDLTAEKIKLIEPIEYEKLYEVTKEPSLFEKIYYLVKYAPKTIKLIYQIYQIFKIIQGGKMSEKTKKAMFGAIRVVLVTLGGLLGWQFLQDQGVEIIIGAISSVWLLIELILANINKKPVVENNEPK